MNVNSFFSNLLNSSRRFLYPVQPPADARRRYPQALGQRGNPGLRYNLPRSNELSGIGAPWSPKAEGGILVTFSNRPIINLAMKRQKGSFVDSCNQDGATGARV